MVNTLAIQRLTEQYLSRVSDIVSLKDRGKFQGILEAVIALSNGFGPVIGGLFAEYTTW